MRLGGTVLVIFMHAVIALSPSNATGAAVSTSLARATTIDGKTIQGSWLGMSPAGVLQLKDAQGKDVSITTDQAMSVRFTESTATQPASEGGYTFYLADGSLFVGKLQASNGKELAITTRDMELQVRLSAVMAIRFWTAALPDAADAFIKAMSNRDTSEDSLISVNRGRVTLLRGVMEELTPHGGTFRWHDRTIPIRPESAYGIVFARGVQEPARAERWCVLRDGSIWGGASMAGDTQHVALKTTFGPELQFNLEEMAELRFHSDRVHFLSDLQSKEYVFEPFGVTKWPFRLNRSVTNRPLRIGGQTFEHGLGMHSQSRLTYELTEPFTKLAGTIGIDDAVRPRGSVVFRVLADGKEVFTSGPVRGDEPPRPILIELNSPKRLDLCVDFGEALDVGDHADWGQIRLIK